MVIAGITIIDDDNSIIRSEISKWLKEQPSCGHDITLPTTIGSTKQSF